MDAIDVRGELVVNLGPPVLSTEPGEKPRAWASGELEVDLTLTVTGTFTTSSLFGLGTF